MMQFLTKISNFILLLFILQVSSLVNGEGILYPQNSETREVKDLSGVWNFRITPLYDQEKGFREKWYQSPLDQTGETIPMPVPSSYNDITQNRTIHDHVGWAWYDTNFFIPSSWQNNSRVFLRFGSAHYNTMVWVNGLNVLNHSVGHLPFQAEVTKYLKYLTLNRITVAINNTLTPDTIPQGKITFKNDQKSYPPGYFEQTYVFDFFNYAGIHRPVFLYTTPKKYIDDITVVTDISGDSTGIIHYDVKATSSDIKCNVYLKDKHGNTVASQDKAKGTLTIKNAHFWWPYLTNSTPGYLYTLTVKLEDQSRVVDIYRLKVGIRKVSWTETQFLINNKPFYFRGFGKHEDYDTVRGKGLDYASVIKDFNLLKWVGANSFRTSHYPYAEEILDQADSAGIVIIDETPGVSLGTFDNELLKVHIQIMKEMYQRDKNRACVVMWSIANEPKSDQKAAGPYFKQVVETIKKLDPTRPATVVLSASYSADLASPYLDVLCVNRYFGWYSDTGKLDLIERQVISEFEGWHKTHKKPILISEYGADTIPGLHTDPATAFSEDYQLLYFTKHFAAFDYLRKQNFFVGELIWNFADFMTQQGVLRVDGNKKGIFTRDRQPKTSAHIVRLRYWELAKAIDNNEVMPNDLWKISVI